jgi:hypothetical protein
MTEGSHQPSGEDLERVVVPLEHTDRHRHATETVWAERLGADRFRLRNVPFYAYDLSYGDIVRGVVRSGGLTLESIVERGGHSTYRLFVTDTEVLQRFLEFWLPLERLGCTLERATERLIAVDVPPEANIHATYEVLKEGEAAGIWDFEEAHVGHHLDN